jgi:hypothetical protein
MTTKAFDDAGHRVSRFLLMQVVVNGTYGLAVAIGLRLMGLEYALLWGFMAAVLRYVPYIGPWIAAILPISLSVAASDGWWQPLGVIGLFLVLELVSNNFMEPWLYGQSIGVSEVALLIAAAFWTFLWGPIGLVLSAPLTVCLVVLGKFVPQLEFLDVLLGDQPALDADMRYYQRVLARDQDEATQLVLEQVKAGDAEQVYDDVLVPALCTAKRDRERDNITPADEAFLHRATREIIEDLGEQLGVPEKTNPSESASKVCVLGCCARDGADELSLEMLKQLLPASKWEMATLPSEVLSSELLERAEKSEPAVVCIASLPPGGLAHTRYLCKRLRARCPDIKIVVGRWGLKGSVDQNRDSLQEAGADWVGTSLVETRNQLNAWLPVFTAKSEPAPRLRCV